MSKLASFNTLPPKPQHIEKVLAVLRSTKTIQIKDLVILTRLTRTQALCALEALMKSGEVTKMQTIQVFSLVDASDEEAQ